MRVLLSIVLASFFMLLALVGVASVALVNESSMANRWFNTFLEAVLPAPQPLALVEPKRSPDSTSTSTPRVLGLQTKSKMLQPDTLYNLINGSRGERTLSPLQINPSLEKAAEELIANRSLTTGSAPLEEATTVSRYGYQARHLVVLESETASSAWSVLQSWHANPKDELLLHSPSFTDMGVSSACKLQSESKCTVILLLASR